MRKVHRFLYGTYHFRYEDEGIVYYFDHEGRFSYSTTFNDILVYSLTKEEIEYALIMEKLGITNEKCN